MEHREDKINSLSLVKRHDGSYFYIKELGSTKGLYKYVLVDWCSNKLGSPIIFYSHTKRSTLSILDKEFFDNNLLSKKRLAKYINRNLYIGGIKKIDNYPKRELKEGYVIEPNYQVYIRDNNYIIIELLKSGEINNFVIYEFVNNLKEIDFEESLIYTEKNLLHLNDEEEYVINNLLNKRRVKEKIKENNGYIGTVEKVKNNYRKVTSIVNENKIKALKGK